MSIHYDTVLADGLVVDGMGTSGFTGNVAITGNRVVAVGTLPPHTATQTLDCTGLVICPGFIDAHVHGDLPLLVDPLHEPAIRQGVTTYICGQDGVAFAPGGETTLAHMGRYTAGFNGNFATPGKTWDSIASLLNHYDNTTALNVALLIPNGNVRMEVLGLDTRAATSAETTQIQGLVQQGLDEGAVGLSSGLDYIPSLYSNEAELAALCQPLSKVQGVYVTHMRGYSPTLAPAALREVFNIGKQAQCPVHVSHFNCLADQTIPILDGSGADITFDLYPYLFGSTTLAMLCLPPELCAGGVDATLARLWEPATRETLRQAFQNPRFPIETIQLASCPHPAWWKYEGLKLTEAAGDMPLVDFVCELLLATDMAAGCIIRHFAERQDSDILALMHDKRMMAGSDGIYVGSFPHPRGTSTFARYVGRFVRIGYWTLEDAIMKCTSMAARRFQLKDRGILKAGAIADVAVFDPESFEDTANYSTGRNLAVGMKHVFVNGTAVLQNGDRTAATPGKGLRRGE